MTETLTIKYNWTASNIYFIL